MQPENKKRNKSIAQLVLPKSTRTAFSVIKSVALPSPAHRRKSDTPSATPRSSAFSSRNASCSGPSYTPKTASYPSTRQSSYSGESGTPVTASYPNSRKSSHFEASGTPLTASYPSTRQSSISGSSESVYAPSTTCHNCGCHTPATSAFSSRNPSFTDFVYPASTPTSRRPSVEPDTPVSPTSRSMAPPRRRARSNSTPSAPPSQSALMVSEWLREKEMTERTKRKEKEQREIERQKEKEERERERQKEKERKARRKRQEVDDLPKMVRC